MAQPDTYTVAYDFSDFQATSPSTPLPGDKVDIEFAEIAAIFAQYKTNLALIQRDDGDLANATVGIDQVDSSLAATMAASGNPRGPWASATVYAKADAVTSGGIAYIAVSAHTAGVFATDLTADKWMSIGGAATGTTFTSTAGISATTVQSAIEETYSEKQASAAVLTGIATISAITLADPSSVIVPGLTTLSAATPKEITSAALLVLDDVTVSAMRGTLGSGSIGDAVFVASAASAARATLGAGSIGETVFTASAASAAQSALALVPGTDVQAYDADTLKADTSDNLTAGFTADSYSTIGVVSGGTVTLDPVNGNFQHYVNGGAHTLAPPSSGNCAIFVQVTNNASAGSITTSGFTDVDGASLTTTNGDDFELYVDWRRLSENLKSTISQRLIDRKKAMQ